jgi:hypothetical protein
MRPSGEAKPWSTEIQNIPEIIKIIEMKNKLDCLKFDKYTMFDFIKS